MPPDSSRQRVYCALPGSILATSLESVALTKSMAPGPDTMALPRWLTSKMPTASRTAVCSFTTPVAYSRGIDQPPNSANFAPSASWRSWRGDCWSVAAMSRNLPQRSDRSFPPASPNMRG